MIVWDEGVYWLVETDGTCWSVDRMPRCYTDTTRLGPIADLDPEDFDPEAARAELRDLRERFLAADSIEGLRREWNAGHYGAR